MPPSSFPNHGQSGSNLARLGRALTLDHHVSWTSFIQISSLTITESLLGFLDYMRVERLYAARNDRHVPPWMRQRYLDQLFLSVASIRPWGSSIGRKISFSFVRPNGERSTRL